MRVANEDLLTVDNVRATVSLGADATLRPIWLGHIVNYAIQLVFTGTPVGSFKLQVSNDVQQNPDPTQSSQYALVTNWTDVANSAFAISAAGNVVWDVANSGSEWVRVVYTRTSSTGTITIARVKVKGA